MNEWAVTMMMNGWSDRLFADLIRSIAQKM